jgi:hypothetical protein
MKQPEILSEKGFDDAWYSTKHETVYDRKLAVLETQLSHDIAHYEALLQNMDFEAQTKVIEATRDLCGEYENNVIPARVATAVKDALDRIEQSWSATNYLSPESGREPVNSITVYDWQSLRQELGK